MKTGFALLVLLAASFQALSQAVENDDMYFTSRDRAKQSLAKINDNNRIADKKDADQEDRFSSTAINPTDSYSARNINPEYTSRSHSDAEDVVEEDGYFSSSYQPTGVNRNLYNNGNNFSSPYYGNGFNNYYGGMGMLGMGGMGMYNPYYGGFGMSPGLSLSLGYGMGMYNGFYGGMGMGYGWGMPSSYFWNRYMYDPFYGYYNPWNSWAYGGFYNPWYGPGFGYGYYPGTVVVIGDNNANYTSYQRRTSRSSSFNNNAVDNSTRNATSSTRNRTVSSAGRVSSSSAQSENYYQRGWRNNGSSTPTTRSQWNNSQWGNSGSNGTSNSGRISNWSNGSNSWNNNSGFGSGNSNNSWSGGGNSRSSWSNGNSGSFGSGSFGGGGGSRTGGSGGGGGGSTRGRH